MYIGLHVKYSFFLADFKEIWILSVDFGKYSIIIFHESPSSEAELFYADGYNKRTDGRGEVSVLLSQFCELVQERSVSKHLVKCHCLELLLEVDVFNLLVPELLFFLILAHSVYKMWIIQEPNTLEFWNKQHFEEGKKNRECIPCLKYSVPIFVE